MDVCACGCVCRHSTQAGQRAISGTFFQDRVSSQEFRHSGEASWTQAKLADPQASEHPAVSPPWAGRPVLLYRLLHELWWSQTLAGPQPPIAFGFEEQDSLSWYSFWACHSNLGREGVLALHFGVSESR